MTASESPLTFLGVFLLGLGLNLTPCVYPVMPLTASFIAGANTTKTRWHGFILSLLYVLGIAIVYCILAVAASLTGKVFGQIQNSTFFYLIVGIMLIFFSMVMFDQITLPAFLGHRAHKLKPESLWSVFLFGMVA